MPSLFVNANANISMQIAITLALIFSHLFATRNNRRESVAEIVAMYVIGMAGWFTISNGLMGNLIYADRMAEVLGFGKGNPLQFQLRFVAISNIYKGLRILTWFEVRDVCAKACDLFSFYHHFT